MIKGLSRFKPGGTRRTHLLLSASLWTIIGLLLLTKGAFRMIRLSEWQPLILVSSLILGCLKAYFILDKSAQRGIDRILNFKDGTCLGAVYSIKTWLLVLCMMGMGVILRNSALPNSILCLLYFTIGWALLLSSRLAWLTWLRGK